MKWPVYILICFLPFTTTIINAQKRTISGQVVSALDELPLKAAAITTISPGPDIYVFTDEIGFYEITLPENTSNLIVCSWGLKTKTIPIRGRSRIDIELEPENVVFDEVLLVYYEDSCKYTGFYDPKQIDWIYKHQNKKSLFGFLSDR